MKNLLKILFLILVLSFLTGCKCQETTVFERVPVQYQEELIQEESYTYDQPIVSEECDASFSSVIEYDEPWWDGTVLRRTAYVTNNEKETGLFEITKVYYLEGKEIDRDTPPREHVIDAGETKHFYLTWYSQQDEEKNIGIDILKTSDLENPVCVKSVVYEEKQGSKTTKTYVNKTKYEVKLKTVCR